MATFFEIFNKVLLELNYRTVTAFEDIYKSEHIKILDAINRVNDEVLSSFEWPFLLRSEVLGEEKLQNINTARDTEGINPENPEHNADTADQNTGTAMQNSALKIKTKTGCIPLTPYIDGVIKSVFQGTKRLLYFPKLEAALQKGLPPGSYTLRPVQNMAQNQAQQGTEPENNTLNGARNDTQNTAQNGTATGNLGVQILVNADTTAPITVYYYSRHTALGANGQFKTKMDEGGDVSILPMPYAEHILLYGTCLKAKANPAYPKFGFWNTMYIQALANLQKNGVSTFDDTPGLNIV